MQEIIDKHLNYWVNIGLSSIPGRVTPAMADPNGEESEGWFPWLPIPSTVTDAELKDLETQIGYPLPESYKAFLKHKHFYELHIDSCSFFRHPSDNWKAKLKERMLDFYLSEELIDKGRIPFADWCDWGLLCFDTTANCEDFDYPIVLWDHERADEYTPQHANFSSMLIELDRPLYEEE